MKIMKMARPISHLPEPVADLDGSPRFAGLEISSIIATRFLVLETRSYEPSRTHISISPSHSTASREPKGIRSV